MNKFPKKLRGKYTWEIINRYKTQIIVLEDMCILSFLIGSEIIILKKECNLQRTAHQTKLFPPCQHPDDDEDPQWLRRWRWFGV